MPKILGRFVIEVYDFEISGSAKEEDKSKDGIVDGAGAFAISNEVQSGGYSESTRKLNFQ